MIEGEGGRDLLGGWGDEAGTGSFGKSGFSLPQVDGAA